MPDKDIPWEEREDIPELGKKMLRDLQKVIDKKTSAYWERKLREPATVRPCPCECNSGGFCGGCGHAGCGGRS